MINGRIFSFSKVAAKVQASNEWPGDSVVFEGKVCRKPGFESLIDFDEGKKDNWLVVSTPLKNISQLG